MSELEVLGLLREALSVASAMAMPLLMAALVTGLAVGLLQALTSIQEMTLTFVPKLGVIVFALWATGSMLMQLIVSLFDESVIGTILRY